MVSVDMRFLTQSSITLPLLFDAENGCNGRGIEDNLFDSTVGLTVEGQRKDLNTIFLKLRITDTKGFNPFHFKCIPRIFF